jgi:hypothetical protein
MVPKPCICLQQPPQLLQQRCLKYTALPPRPKLIPQIAAVIPRDTACLSFAAEFTILQSGWDRLICGVIWKQHGCAY